jgi:tRNA 2-selenouridine synthase SelU
VKEIPVRLIDHAGIKIPLAKGGFQKLKNSVTMVLRMKVKYNDLTLQQSNKH